MGVPKRLTEMQQRFAEFLVFGGPDGPMTQTEAAVAAGYSAKRARQEGSELCNPKLSPLVVKYIGQLKEERLKKHEVTYEGHVAELARPINEGWLYSKDKNSIKLFASYDKEDDGSFSFADRTMIPRQWVRKIQKI